MPRLHVLLHATLSDEPEAITDTFSFESEDPMELGKALLNWLKTQAAEVERGLTEDLEADRG